MIIHKKYHDLSKFCLKNRTVEFEEALTTLITLKQSDFSRVLSIFEPEESQAKFPYHMIKRSVSVDSPVSIILHHIPLNYVPPI